MAIKWRKYKRTHDSEEIDSSDTNPLPVSVITSDSYMVDAFGRQRTSSPYTVFDSKQIFTDTDIAVGSENSPLFFDNKQISGAGTSSLYSNNRASTTLSVSANTEGRRIRQTRRRFNYQPGKSLLCIFTERFGSGGIGITKKCGLFDDKNGIFLRQTVDGMAWVIKSYVTGTAVDNAVLQSSWNIDTLDGNGVSGIVLDPTKVLIPFLDFEWLGAGTVAVGFFIDRKAYYVHYFNHSNRIDSVYMSTPNLPLRCEISNDGTGAVASLEQICATVISEGGQEDTGVVHFVSSGTGKVDCNVLNQEYAILGIRLKSNYLGATIKLISSFIQIQTASHQILYQLKFNPTVAGTFTYIDVPNSSIQVAYGALANTVTNGSVLSGGYVTSGGEPTGGAGQAESSLNNALSLGSLIDGTPDILVLTATPIAGSTNVDVAGTISYRELI